MPPRKRKRTTYKKPEPFDYKAVKLECPYTGAEQAVEYDDNLGQRNGFYLAGGANMALPFLTKESALEACPDLVCKYTGVGLKLRENPATGLWHLQGAFNNDTRFTNLETAVYMASLRLGSSDLPFPVKVKVEVKEKEAPAPNPFEDKKGLHDVDEVVKDVLAREDEE